MASCTEPGKDLTSPGGGVALLLLGMLGTCFLEAVQVGDEVSLAWNMFLTLNTPFIVVPDPNTALESTLLIGSFTAGTVGNPRGLLGTAKVFPDVCTCC